MGNSLYYVLLIYFTFGAFIIALINKKKSKQEIKQAWIKFGVYFGITSVLYFTILYNPNVFRFFTGIIVVFSMVEILRLRKITGKNSLSYSFLLLASFPLSGFFAFSFLSTEILMFTFFITMTFDAFSQMTGQLLGKTKILPSVSPNKTLEGLLGGLVLALLSSFFIGKFLDWKVETTMIIGLLVCIFAFLGDLLASFVKRRFGVKDYSNFIPGHGGFLDRFDSFIVSGSAVYVFTRIFLI